MANDKIVIKGAREHQKSRSILSFYNKMRFAFFSRSKALYYFIERRNRGLARYDNC